MSDRMNSYTAQPLTFEDLRGLRAEGYVRDSTLDQRDGFGPDIQRNNIIRFAESYGLVLGDSWYTEFVSGRSVKKRTAFMQFVEDAKLDQYDVMLVDHTSRFGRNQEECIRYKSILRDLGKVVVFVGQGIISGSDRDFLSERINETLDEAYSRNLSRYVKAGFSEKASQGFANGKPPLGYTSEKLPNGKRERKVPDPRTLPALKELLASYSTGKFSFRTLADYLNSKGYRTNLGKLFTKGSVEHVLENRFYEGKAVYHPGKFDEEVREGIHQVPREISELWLKCQEVKSLRIFPWYIGHGSSHRIYPFSGVLTCDKCGSRYHGEAHQNRRKAIQFRMYHSLNRCGTKPLSVSADELSDDFSAKVLSYIDIGNTWKDVILGALNTEVSSPDVSNEIEGLKTAMGNLRKQHLWGIIDDRQFKKEFQLLERQLRPLISQRKPVNTPNLDRAAEILMDLPSLWSHPGVNNEQKKDLLKEVFEDIRLKDRRITSVTPRPVYKPLFASMCIKNRVVGSVGVVGIEPTTSCSQSKRASAALHPVVKKPGQANRPTLT